MVAFIVDNTQEYLFRLQLQMALSEVTEYQFALT